MASKSKHTFFDLFRRSVFLIKSVRRNCILLCPTDGWHRMVKKPGCIFPNQTRRWFSCYELGLRCFQLYQNRRQDVIIDFSFILSYRSFGWWLGRWAIDFSSFRLGMNTCSSTLRWALKHPLVWLHSKTQLRDDTRGHHRTWKVDGSRVIGAYDIQQRGVLKSLAIGKSDGFRFKCRSGSSFLCLSFFTGLRLAEGFQEIWSRRFPGDLDFSFQWVRSWHPKKTPTGRYWLKLHQTHPRARCSRSKIIRIIRVLEPRMLSREFSGILLLIGTGICVTGDMVTSKFIEASKWPYWHLVAGARFYACKEPILAKDLRILGGISDNPFFKRFIDDLNVTKS